MSDREISNEQLAIAECEGEFWLSLHDAIRLAGGRERDNDELEMMTVGELAQGLAVNGVRISYRDSDKLSTKLNIPQNEKPI